MAVNLAAPEVRARLEGFIARAAGVASAALTGSAPLTGGALQENVALDVQLGAASDPQRFVLRISPGSAIPESLTRAQEFAVARAAFEAGVTTPEPLWLCTDPAVLGADFAIMRRAEGVAAAHRLVREPALGGPREALLGRLGEELARLHTVQPPRPDLAFLPSAAPTPALAMIARLRGWLDAHATPRPALEWALRRLELRAPATEQVVLCHGDFRTGNYLVDEQGLTAILDWELAHWGDPVSDLGWFTARCWRAGRPEQRAGGIGPVEPLLAGYERASGRTVDLATLDYWEAMAHARWALIAIHQSERHAPGEPPALEQALTGYIVPELEYEAMCMLDAAAAPSVEASEPRPDATAGLLEIARAALLADVAPGVPADRRYALLMVANALGIAARAAAAGDGPTLAALAAVEALYPAAYPTVAGAAGGSAAAERLAWADRVLIADIRAGVYDGGAPHGRVATLLLDRTREAVRVSNPRYLDPGVR